MGKYSYRTSVDLIAAKGILVNYNTAPVSRKGWKEVENSFVREGRLSRTKAKVLIADIKKDSVRSLTRVSRRNPRRRIPHF